MKTLNTALLSAFGSFATLYFMFWAMVISPIPTTILIGCICAALIIKGE